jgi:hypothetical protein
LFALGSGTARPIFAIALSMWVPNGKRSMPPWDDVLKPDDLDALWA